MGTTGEMKTESLMEDTTTEESTLVIKLECTDEQIQMEEKQEELERLKTLLAQKEQENDLLRMKIRTCQVPYPLTAECGYLKEGDGLMVDKGFLIEKDVQELGLNLNIPPIAKN
ncbi:hypothetical protein F2P79_015290 [Pimephales promelas]|nr:hypothetical protein F2P79_015290 [Pimephales promelas]